MCCDLSCFSRCCCCFLYLIIVNMISWVSAWRYCPCHVSVSLSLAHSLTRRLSVHDFDVVGSLRGQYSNQFDMRLQFPKIELPLACCLLPAAFSASLCGLQTKWIDMRYQIRDRVREETVGYTWQARRSSAMAHNIIIIHSAEQEIAVLISKGFT